MTTVAPPPSAPSAPSPTSPPEGSGDGRRALPWERIGLAALLAATAALYLIGLSESGWGNSFYAAAAQAGSESWKAFFFGSSDAANSITVDKTPLALWPMGLSVRIFGLSSWSILVPQALEGVACVAVLYAAVKRATGSAGAALLAGATMALTPVAVLMFRFDNPDAMLVLLLTGSAYAVQRAVEASRTDGGRPTRWLVLAGALVGLGFLAKMLQAFLVLPALGLAYLIFAGVPLAKRFGQLLLGFGAMVLAAGWWIAIVELWPASSRPYIGGSQNNSILELTLGYNGFGRLTGNETGSVGGGGGGNGGGMWGETGLGRLFNDEIGAQAAWLIPAALILGIAALLLVRRLPVLERVRARAGVTIWLGWLVTTGLTFSFMAGIFHAYYTVALAPAIGALVGIGGWAAWQRRTSLWAGAVLGATLAFTSVWGFVLLGRSDWQPWLRWVVLIGGLATALVLAGVSLLPRRIAAATALLAVVLGLAAPGAYSLATASEPHTGSIPSAGPAGSGGFGFGGGRPGGMGGMPGGTPPTGTQGTPPTGTQGGTQGGLMGTLGQGMRSAGSLIDGSDPSAEMVALLEQDADSYTWVAATIGSQSAAGYQLATEHSVMPIGGFNGSDPSPTLAQFQALVADGEIHYFIGSGVSGMGSMGGSDAAAEIAAWVAANYTAQTVDGTTVYDLTSPTS
ncbi:hypothetical protein GCM10022215_21550 [Nocardioides fonticola]|uniref:Glycosyl transferase n=1 Tax=Nocardioides fonticola TaxID=450363 RepID=A0ABP7XJF0_9ACTN